MARGRPRLSPEAKARRKEEKEAAKAQSVAADALSKVPQEAEARRALFNELSEAKSEVQSAAGAVGAQKKRMQDVHGIDAKTISILQTVMALRQGRRECVIRQVKFFIKDFGLDAQLDLFDDKAVGEKQSDGGSVFDNSGAGERHAAERGDDPARARRRAGPPPAPKAPTPGLSSEEALAGFKEASAKKPPRGGNVVELDKERPAVVGLGPDAIH